MAKNIYIIIPQVLVGDLLCDRLIEQATGQALKNVIVWRVGPPAAKSLSTL